MAPSLHDRHPALAPLAMVFATTLGGCGGSDAGRPAQTTTTGLTVPRPEATGTTKRTIDNTGFVDNGGRTSEMTTRSEMSGMRATEAGGERPTGTPGSGTPIPTPPSAPPRNVGEVVEGGRTPTASPRGSMTSTQPRGDGPSDENAYRLARARCDRETACNRIGGGRAWSTQDSCVSDQRERVRADFASLSCMRGVDSVQLGACLNAMRVRPCEDAGPELDTVTECRSSALCSP